MVSDVPPVWRTGGLCGDAVTATVVLVLPVDGAVVVVRRVQPAGVEPALDPADQFAAGLGPGGPAPAVSVFTLHGPEPALSDAVVPAHPGRAHRLHDTVGVAQLSEGRRCVDRPAVAVEHDAGDMAAPRSDGHGERVGDEFGAHVIGGGPADHPTREQVD